jgi:YD repeat-containing protein
MAQFRKHIHYLCEAQYNYCSCGALDSVQDADRYVTTFNYDNAGRRLSVVYPDQYALTNQYDLLGRATNTIDSAGVSVTNWFNNQGLRYATSNAFGQVNLRIFDIKDRPTNSVDMNGVGVVTVYDNLDRPAANSYPDGGANRYGYSAFGLIAYTNQLTNVTYYGYDAVRRKIAETNALLKVTQYGYDPAGDLASLTDAKTNTTQWGYDVYGRVTSQSGRGDKHDLNAPIRRWQPAHQSLEPGHERHGLRVRRRGQFDRCCL